MKFLVENEHKIELANSKLLNILMREQIKSDRAPVLYNIFDDNKRSYFISDDIIYFLKGFDVWFTYVKKYEKYLYAFGAGKINKKETNEPLLILDFPESGSKNSFAVFAEDDDSTLLLFLTDLFSKSMQFSSNRKIPFDWQEIHGSDGKKNCILIGKLIDANIVEKICNFLKHVDLNRNISVEKNKKNTDQKISPDVLIDQSDDPETKIDAYKTLRSFRDGLHNQYFTRNSILKSIKDPEIVDELDNKLEKLLKLGFLKESGFGIFFITAQGKSFLEDNPDLIKAKDVDNMSITGKMENSCEICGSKLSPDKISQTDESQELCKDCSRKAYAARSVDELLNYIDYDVVFDKNDLIFKVPNPMKVLDYIWTLEEFNLMERVAVNQYKLKSEDEIKIFQNKFGVRITSVKPAVSQKSEISSKTCLSCNRELPVSQFSKSNSSDDGYSEDCKDCSRSSHAANALTDLMNYVETDVHFDKNDLLEQVDNKMQFLDYIWTLQEFDLIEMDEKTNKYILKSGAIEKFTERYGKITLTVEKKVSGKKIVKKCPFCLETLPLSKFYKSSNTDDGYSKECRECSDKLNAAKILDKIQDYINKDSPFTKKELLEKIDDATQVNSYIWTLQEHDLIEHNLQSDTYQIKINSKFEEFCNNYLSKPETDSEKGTEDIETSEETTLVIEKREIIYISDHYDGDRVNIIMNAVVKNDELLSMMQGLNSFISSNLNKYLVFRCSKDHSEVMIDLEIDKESQETTLNLLKEENWENRALDRYKRPT